MHKRMIIDLLCTAEAAGLERAEALARIIAEHGYNEVGI